MAILKLARNNKNAPKLLEKHFYILVIPLG